MKKKVIAALIGSAIFSSPTIAMETQEESFSSEALTKGAKGKSVSAEIQEEVSIKKVLTVDEFNKEIKDNPFLQSYGANHEMEPREQQVLEDALKYEFSSSGGIISRPLEEFKGNTLVVGGGKKLGDAAVFRVDNARGRTDLTQLNRELKWLKEDNKFYQVDGKVLGSSDRYPTKEEKEEFKKIIETKIQNTLDTYYTVNIDAPEDPDLLASITSVSDTSSIPDGSFEEIIFENVDTLVWLNPNIFPILERITKSGGTIFLDGVVQPRLLVTAFAHTKWADKINEQVKGELEGKHWGNDTNRLEIRLKNE